jgi:hypothetical protein
MSLFGDLDLENAPDDPNAIPDDVYKAFLTDVKKGPTQKNPEKVGVTFKYKISEGKYEGREVTEWKSAMKDDDEQTKGYLKARLLSLGVPEDRLGAVEADDLIGKEVRITVKNRNGYTNIQRCVLESSDASDADKDIFSV